MNESTPMQLKVLVERIVRPIRASDARKRRMRDELLAHVMATFEQELEKLGNESAALEKTAVRLGDPADLTRQLQQSVSVIDRARSFVDWMWYRPGEVWFVRARRQAAILVGPLIPFLLFTLFMVKAKFSSREISNEAIRVIEPTVISILLIAIGYPFFIEWMFRAVYGRRGKSWPKIIVVALTCGAILVAVALFLGDRNASDLLLSAFFGAIWIPTSLAHMAQAIAMRIRHEQQWEALPL